MHNQKFIKEEEEAVSKSLSSPLCFPLRVRQNVSEEVHFGLYGLAAFVGVDPYIFWEEGHLVGHLLNHRFVHRVPAGLDFGSDTHFHVLVLQGEEGHKVVYEVSVNQAAVPEATWGKAEPRALGRGR